MRKVCEDERSCEDVDVVMFFFFKQKTAYEIYQCDWSSDVCSSDLGYSHHANGTGQCEEVGTSPPGE